MCENNAPMKYGVVFGMVGIHGTHFGSLIILAYLQFGLKLP